MNAQSNRLGAVADNIANVNTTGYKRASTEFSSFIPSSATAEYVSGSVNTDNRRLISQQGNLSYTTSVTDLAIDGNGFFIVSDPGGSNFLTRAGAFTKNGDGELYNAAGYFLMGYPLDEGTPAIVANGTEGLERVTISDLALTAVQSTEGTYNSNLPADAPIIAAANLPAANAATAEYTAKTSLVATADLGRQVTLDIYWAKSAANTWQISVFDRAAQAATGEFPYSSGPLVSTSVSFDPSTGAIATGSPTNITVPVPGGSNMLLDFSATSQLATDEYILVRAEVNGNGPSPVDRIEIDNAGILYSVYENGARVPTYQIPLANVIAPDNLIMFPGDVFSPSATSGDLQIGFANQGGLGSLSSSALEQSTVDLANELTTMIEAERHYSVNSKVFQTGSDLLDVLVNLKR